MKIKINNKEITDNKRPFYVAEAGINYDGDFKKCFELIDAAKSAGADAIKFQTHLAEHEMLDTKIMLAHSKKETVFDLMKKCELTLKQHKKLKKYCEKKKIIFLSTPFSIQAADLLKKISVKAIKIGSGECNNLPLIEHVAKFKKPTIISTGMNSLASITKTFNFAKKINNKIILMHCISMYPAPSSKSMLDTIPVFKKIFKCPVGFSDHSDDIYLAVAAVALGANIIEKHFTVSKKWSGPDIKLSITPDKFKKMVEVCNEVHSSKGIRNKILKEEIPVTNFAFASVVTLKKIKKNEKFSKKNIWVKRPGTGKIPAKDLDKIFNKRSNKTLLENCQLKYSDIKK
jgi:sialic acid synthase SpsE